VWTFGDGGAQNTTATSMSRTYAIAGTYNVTLQVTDDKGATGSVTKPVTVGSTTTPTTNTPPVANFNFSCDGLTCSFLDASTDPGGAVTGRSWTFGDGGTSTATNPTRTYATGGTYTVTLTVSDAQGAIGTKSQAVTVSGPSSPVSGWDRVLQDTIVTGNLAIPAGQKWLIGRNVQVAGNVLVQDATLGMRPGSTLKIVGADPNRYVGGGLHYSATVDSDRGVWVWGTGQLDISCTPKAGWNRTGVDPTWLPNDEYWIAPTAVGDFQPKRWTPGQAIPRVHSAVPATEVLNVTRDCTIEGPGHIHIHSSRPQRVEYVQLRALGVSNAAFGGVVLGRYALHMHFSGTGTVGTVVRGVAAVESRGTVFVPHASHGITMVDNVSINSYGDGLWWDLSHETNDLLVDHMAIIGVGMPGGVSGGVTSTHDAFLLGAGTNMEVRNSVAAGARGSDQSIGFEWPEPTPIFNAVLDKLVWKFNAGNVAHNNLGAGLRFWNNSAHQHVVDQYVSYRNQGGSIENGAYVNLNEYLNITSLEDGYGTWYGGMLHSAVTWNSNSGEGGGRTAAIRNAQFIALQGPALTIGHRQLPAASYMAIDNVTLTPGPNQPKLFITEGTHPWWARFTRTAITPDDIRFETMGGGNEGTSILIDHPDGRKWEVKILNGQKVVTNR
jgi:PKD repeat protein